MIDNGASKHTTSDLNMLKDPKVISPIMIDLPNEDQTVAIIQGKVELGMMDLVEMLYVLKLSCNLI